MCDISLPLSLFRGFEEEAVEEDVVWWLGLY